MKPEWVDLICDPYDQSPLRLENAKIIDGRIVSGTLVSAGGRHFPIRSGIPIFVGEGMQAKESVESFAYEWDEFGFLFAQKGWVADLINPLVGSPDFFRDKTIIDAGAGSGAQSRWMAEAGAKLVFSLELSDVVFSRHRDTIAPVSDRVFAIQADIAFPPVRNPVDVVYCINVAQHTKDPRQTFGRLAKLVRQGGWFLFNIYHKRSEVKFRVVKAFRSVVRVLPYSVWKALAAGIAGVGFALATIPFLAKPVRFFVPVSHSFRETWLDTYDAFGPHWYQENMRPEDQVRMIGEEGLQIERVTQFAYVLRPMTGR
jgi:2-polyprenyl-3-methyl-5-hydroxy-6-metoxy-1,4-benzoquinol methylase